jgi:hypothetical protein
MSSYFRTFAQMQTELASAKFLNDPNHVVYGADLLKDELNRANNESLDIWNQAIGGDVGVKAGPNISATAGVQEYDLPADFLTFKGGHVLILAGADGQEYKELKEIDYRDTYIQGTSDQQEAPVAFCVVGSYGKTTVGETQTTTYAKLRLFPIPDNSYTISIKYVPISPDLLVADSDVSSIPGNYHDLIVLRAALKIAEGKGYADLVKMWGMEYEKRSADFKVFIPNRGQPREVEIVDVFL